MDLKVLFHLFSRIRVKYYKMIIRLVYFQPFLHLHFYSMILLKTLWEEEKLLVTSNFSSSHSVFYPFGEISRRFHQIKDCCLQILSVWKGLSTCGQKLSVSKKKRFFLSKDWKHGCKMRIYRSSARLKFYVIVKSSTRSRPGLEINM